MSLLSTSALICFGCGTLPSRIRDVAVLRIIPLMQPADFGVFAWLRVFLRALLSANQLGFGNAGVQPISMEAMHMSSRRDTLRYLGRRRGLEIFQAGVAFYEGSLVIICAGGRDLFST